MKKPTLLAFLLLAISYHAGAQIQVAKFMGKDKEDYRLGFGAFLKFSYPIMQSADLTLEGGANYFQEKNYSDYGVATIPVKLGFCYLLSSSGSGFYVEPQAGYNFFGVNQNDDKFTGVVLAGAAGYLFKPLGKIQFDLGFLYEKAFNSGTGKFDYAAVRLTHNFSFGRKRDAE